MMPGDGFTKAQLRQVREIIREEIARADLRRVRGRLRLSPKRFRPCGTGHRMPKCWGSTINGPTGCYCGDGP